MVIEGMYGLLQAGRISHDALLKHLYLYGYYPSSNLPGLWKQNSPPIKFTLVVDDFDVKYLGKEQTLHLKTALKIYIYGNHRLGREVVHWDSTKLGL